MSYIITVLFTVENCYEQKSPTILSDTEEILINLNEIENKCNIMASVCFVM